MVGSESWEEQGASFNAQKLRQTPWGREHRRGPADSGVLSGAYRFSIRHPSVYASGRAAVAYRRLLVFGGRLRGLCRMHGFFLYGTPFLLAYCASIECFGPSRL